MKKHYGALRTISERAFFLIIRKSNLNEYDDLLKSFVNRHR